MGKGTKQIFQESVSKGFNSLPHNGSLHDQWVVMDADDDISNSASPATSFEGSTTSGGASSEEEDLREDASSSSSSTLYSSPASSPQQLSKGPLYELSELMAQLPIKRGLSKHYQGKSQSFTSLSSVRCLEDLAKRENPYRKNMKPCKSYGGGLDGYKPHTPKATISKKKGSRGSFPSLLGKRSSVMGSHRLQIPVQRIQ